MRNLVPAIFAQEGRRRQKLKAIAILAGNRSFCGRDFWRCHQGEEHCEIKYLNRFIRVFLLHCWHGFSG